jgi:hypothetical protein
MLHRATPLTMLRRSPCYAPHHATPARQAHGARELVREGERSSTAEELLAQLRAALVTESGRVAMAWEQRERMRAVVAERDGTLRQLQTESFHLSEDLAASREQVTQLQEQRRLGEILLEGAEERNRLRQVAYNLLGGHTYYGCTALVLTMAVLVLTIAVSARVVLTMAMPCAAGGHAGGPRREC